MLIKIRRLFYITLLLCLCFTHMIWADDKERMPDVTVSIQSHDKVLAQKEVQARTFLEALQKCTAALNLVLQISDDSSEASVLSVGSIRNNTFSLYDGWFGYVGRGQSVQRPSDYLTMKLEDGDKVVLYYGHATGTRILTDFGFQEDNGRVSFNPISSSTTWTEKNGVWQSEQATSPLDNIKIHIIVPGGTRKILVTDSKGNAKTIFSKLGMYKYYVEAYRFKDNPGIVQTEDFYYFYGISNPARVTRAEACSFLINYFALSSGENEKFFSDITAETKYRSEIAIAASRGIINGYPNGEFHPDGTITLMQICVMLSQIYGVDTASEGYEEIPAWARDSIYTVDQHNLLDGINRDFDTIVTEEILTRLYFNFVS